MSVYARDVGEGRPLVLIPGFGLNHEVWEGQVRALVEEHRVVCIDLRGTGRSDKPTGGYGIDRLADDVLEVLESLDLHEVTLVGWSFGGQVAFRLAARSPERLRQLVLIASNGVRASRSEDFPFGPDADSLETALVRAGRMRHGRRHGGGRSAPASTRSPSPSCWTGFFAAICRCRHGPRSPAIGPTSTPT